MGSSSVSSGEGEGKLKAKEKEKSHKQKRRGYSDPFGAGVMGWGGLFGLDT
jgi:hypothetical protein